MKPIVLPTLPVSETLLHVPDAYINPLSRGMQGIVLFSIHYKYHSNL
jgi:hypothetical protein